MSEAVLEEAAGGDAQAPADRLDVAREIQVLNVTDEVNSLAEQLLNQIPLPERAAIDAVHIAMAVVHGMDYLLTWNCTHIANAVLRPRIDDVCHRAGYEPPVICTPEELMEEQ